jgi:deoxyribodipyrimidine photolyase
MTRRGFVADAAPYFRVFNPSLQGAKFDPDGDYVRRWVPEIGKLPNTLLRSPWEARPIELADAGIAATVRIGGRGRNGGFGSMVRRN